MAEGTTENQGFEEDDEKTKQGEEKNKDAKKYLKVMETVQAVIGGKDNLKPKKKVTGDVTASIVADLFKEEEEELRIKVKQGLKDLLKKHIELETEVSKKQKELEELQNKKRKEFTQAANQWLQQVDQGEIMKEGYQAALKTAFSSPKEESK